MHYNRWYKNGDPNAVLQDQAHGLTLDQRLDLRTDKSGDCWVWTGSLTEAGYGQIRVGNGPKYAHRLSYERHKGPIPKGMMVCHHCDNPKCLNPDHLFLGDQFANMADMWRKGRANPGTTRGVAHPRAKITEDDVRAIRASPLSQDKLGAQYGLSQASVHAIIARKSWRHI